MTYRPTWQIICTSRSFPMGMTLSMSKLSHTTLFIHSSNCANILRSQSECKFYWYWIWWRFIAGSLNPPFSQQTSTKVRLYKSTHFSCWDNMMIFKESSKNHLTKNLSITPSVWIILIYVKKCIRILYMWSFARRGLLWKLSLIWHQKRENFSSW